MKRAVIALSVVCALLIAGIAYAYASNPNAERIEELNAELTRMQSSRDSLQMAVAYKDSVQRMLRTQIRDKEAEAEDLRAEVKDLEAERQQEALDVRRLDSFPDIKEKFLATFPELEGSARVTEVDRNGFGFTYIMLPLASVETFILDSQDVSSYKKQRDLLLTVDSLQTEIGTLQDEVLTLEEEKAQAYQSGYNEAFQQYESLNQEYIATLKQPPTVRLFSSGRTAALSGAAGGVLGVVVGATSCRIGGQ